MLFTGDLVNVYAEEADYYLEMMQKLHAPLGQFAVLGNHDYGHTHAWPSPETESENHLRIQDRYARMGFNLLKNESLLLTREGQSIRLAGVENWGRKPFPQKGDLRAALADSLETDFIILMSHDPTHWDAHTLQHERKVHLTLSGHTHGAQMGIEIPGFRFSPAQWIYPRWAGLYEESGRFLYVNRGFGHLGFPGRMGIAPEIAVIELRKG
jgi:predicted MPP superfamily phosphohydrolase